MSKDNATMSHREVLEALSGLMLVLFVALLSGTIVSTGLPRIVGDLHGTQSQYTWVVTAALLTATASTPIWGRLADLFNKKTLIQIGITIFVVGSVVAGFSHNTEQLIAARAFQGLGMGALQSLVQVVMAAMIPPRERGKYNGYLGAVMALATVGGPLLGGVIVDSALGWRWCFFIGVPVAVAAFALLQKTLHVETLKQANVKIDYAGSTLIAAGVSLILVWITFAGTNFGWISWSSLCYVAGGLILLGAAIVVETRAAQPVVPLRIIVQRTPALAIVASLSVGMAMFGAAVFLGQYFQLGRGYSPTEAGLLTIPMMFGLLLSSTISGRMVSRSGKIKPYLITGMAALVVGFGGLAFVDHSTSLVLIGFWMLVAGAGVGMTMQNLILAVQNSVAMKDMGASSGAVTFFRSLGGTIGVAVLGAVLATGVTTRIRTGLGALVAQDPSLADPIQKALSSGSLDFSQLPAAALAVVRASYGDAIGHMFIWSAVIAVAGLIASFFFKDITLRTTVDLHEAKAEGTGDAPVAAAKAAKAARTPAKVAGPHTPTSRATRHPQKERTR